MMHPSAIEFRDAKWNDTVQIEVPEKELRIVGFEVTPRSIANSACDAISDENKMKSIGPAVLIPNQII